MGLNLFDPHRIDQPDYQSPRDRASAALNAPVPMTINGLSEAQLDAKAAQTRRAEQAKTTSNDVVAHAFALAKAVRAAQQSHNDSVERQREDLRFDSDTAMAQRLAFGESESAQTLSAASDTIDAWLDSKRQAAQQVLEGLGQYGEEGREQRDRAWARTKLRVDRAQDDASGKSTVQVAREAIATARPEELAVLIQELPEYLSTLGFQAEFLDAEVAAKVPEYAAAQRDLRNAERDSAVVRHDIAAVQRGIASGLPVPEKALVDPQVVEHRVGDVGA